ncbi:MAG: hypothetical protein QF470_07560, partial [Methylococcales bacterium]|nr:hypothetical protein [Methylococcales bacterium]
GDILTVAFAAQYEQDGAGTQAQPADFTGYSVDLLGETTLGNGAVATVEAQYKRFELDGNDSGTGTLGMFEGDAYTGTALYLMPGKVGIGQLQPYVRYTNNDGNGTPNRDEYEAGLNYIIDGHNARVSLMYQYGDIATKGRTYSAGRAGDDVHAIKIGFQMQI